MSLSTGADGHTSMHRGRLEQVVQDYGADWYALLENERAELFLGPDWLQATAAARHLLDAVEVVVQLDPRGRPVSLLPFLHRQGSAFGLPLLMWETPGNMLVTYHMALLGQSAATRFLDQAIGEADRPPDVLSLPCVVQGSAWESTVLDFAARRNWIVTSYSADESPYLPIDVGWDDFLKSKSSNFRYNLRRKEKALAKRGTVNQRWYTREEDVSGLIDAMLQVEAGSWKADADMAISDSQMEQRYYHRLLPFLARSEALLANALLLDGEPVAYSVCYAWNGKVGQLKTSFVERLSDASPGLVVNSHAVQRAFEMGLAEFDFLGDILPHKTHWTDSIRRHTHYYLYAPTLKGRLVGNLKRLGRKLDRERVRHSTLGRGAHRKTQQD